MTRTCPPSCSSAAMELREWLVEACVALPSGSVPFCLLADATCMMLLHPALHSFVSSQPAADIPNLSYSRSLRMLNRRRRSLLQEQGTDVQIFAYS